MFSKATPSLYNFFTQHLSITSGQVVQFDRLMNPCWFHLILADSETSFPLPPEAINPSLLYVKQTATMKPILRKLNLS